MSEKDDGGQSKGKCVSDQSYNSLIDNAMVADAVTQFREDAFVIFCQLSVQVQPFLLLLFLAWM